MERILATIGEVVDRLERLGLTIEQHEARALFSACYWAGVFAEMDRWHRDQQAALARFTRRAAT